MTWHPQNIRETFMINEVNEIDAYIRSLGDVESAHFDIKDAPQYSSLRTYFLIGSRGDFSVTMRSLNGERLERVGNWGIEVISPSGRVSEHYIRLIENKIEEIKNSRAEEITSDSD